MEACLWTRFVVWLLKALYFHYVCPLDGTKTANPCECRQFKHLLIFAKFTTSNMILGALLSWGLLIIRLNWGNITMAVVLLYVGPTLAYSIYNF